MIQGYCTAETQCGAASWVRSRVALNLAACFVLLGIILRPLQAAELRPATRDNINRLIEKGQWRRAIREIGREQLRSDLDYPSRQALSFQSEKFERIKLDFPKSRNQVLHELRQVVPAIDDALLTKWEKAGSVESINIDGSVWYFEQAAANVFRVNAEAKALQAKQQPDAASTYPYAKNHLRDVLSNYHQTGQRLSTAKTFRVHYGLTVKPDVVPHGETIRAWLPFPQTGGRQAKVRLISSDPPQHILSPEGSPIRSIYLEKAAQTGQTVPFKIVFEYEAAAFHQPISADVVKPIDAADPALAYYLQERLPHIAFSEEIKTLSRQITGTETNALLKARRIFQWIDDNIPWASAREYSTLDSLPHYALTKRWGDCGIQTMLFMALCRYNGIPARWESGWICGPVKTMHDWCQVYLAPYGWVPVDCSYGLVADEDEELKWFYLGGTDGYRLAVNTEYDQPLYPAKLHHRSEIVDFQRGEVEWQGGNLYFNQWTYDFEVAELPAK